MLRIIRQFSTKKSKEKLKKIALDNPEFTQLELLMWIKKEEKKEKKQK
jgi:hypothetical protein